MAPAFITDIKNAGALFFLQFTLNAECAEIIFWQLPLLLRSVLQASSDPL